MFDVHGCLKPRGTRSTLRSYWSVQIHATRNQFTAHERKGAYTSRDLKLLRRERQRERYKTIDLLQNTATSRGNATTWPLFRRRL